MMAHLWILVLCARDSMWMVQAICGECVEHVVLAASLQSAWSWACISGTDPWAGASHTHELLVDLVVLIEMLHKQALCGTAFCNHCSSMTITPHEELTQAAPSHLIRLGRRHVHHARVPAVLTRPGSLAGVLVRVLPALLCFNTVLLFVSIEV